jgi:tetratricopeptide (TPR) repeat protein
MYALVRTYLRAQKSDEAITFLQSVIKANPTNAEAYVLLGSVQLATKAPDQARQNFLTAIAKQPTKDIGYRALADLYLLQNNNQEALKAVQAGLKEQPNSFVLHLALADILERIGNYDGAISEYNNLLTDDPGSIVVANNLASLLADYHTDKASLDRAKELAASLQKSPLPQFKDTLGWVDYREGDYNAALPLLKDAAAAMPTLPLVLYHLGMNYLALGQPDKAAEQFNTALAQKPDQELQDKIHTAQTKGRTE